MNKSHLLAQIVRELEALLQVAMGAAQQAYNTATHEENVAENKYDTLGLEAAYLAQGQSRRVAECEADLAAFMKLAVTTFNEEVPVTIGALIELRDEHGMEHTFFLGPAAGGLKFAFGEKEIMIITPSAPLGRALIGHSVGDEVEMTVAGQQKRYEVVALK